jgi:probable HAF family extracellular repeat protein
MRIHRRFRNLIVAILPFVVVPGAVVNAQQSTAAYTVTDLGGLPGLAYRQSVAFAINDAGEIAGSSYTVGPNGPEPHAIVWVRDASNNYVITDLGILSAATGISNEGVVGTNFGFIVVPATVNGVLVWYEDANGDGHNDLAIPISTGGRAVVNDNMQIADGNQLVQFDAAGNEIVTTLPNKGIATAINDYGEVAGYSSSAQATIWQIDALGIILATDTLAMLPGYTMSSALSIDAQGQVAGYSSGFKGNQIIEHAVLWQSPAAAPIDLGVLTRGGHSQASGVNTVNHVTQVVGAASVSSGSTAFLWKNGVMTDLNKSVSAPGISLQAAYAVNSHGQIVASAKVTVGKNVETHAVLLIPN